MTATGLLERVLPLKAQMAIPRRFMVIAKDVPVWTTASHVACKVAIKAIRQEERICFRLLCRIQTFNQVEGTVPITQELQCLEAVRPTKISQ